MKSKITKNIKKPFLEGLLNFACVIHLTDPTKITRKTQMSKSYRLESNKLINTVSPMNTNRLNQIKLIEDHEQ